jgi:hypothetical protein
MSDELASITPSASSSSTDPFNVAIMSLLTKMNDRLLSMDNRLISMDDLFLTMDQCMYPLETNVAQIKLNVQNTLHNILPEDLRDQVPRHLFLLFLVFLLNSCYYGFLDSFLFDIVDNFLEGLVYSILPFVLL